MSGSFEVTTATNTVVLTSARRGTAPFTVTNKSGRPVRGRAKLVAQDGMASSWLSIQGDVERQFGIATVHQYTVEVAVPASAPAGTYQFRLDMLAADTPDEDYSTGQTVTFAVPENKPKPTPFPWWVLGLAAVLVITAILAYVLWPRTAIVPAVARQTIADARSLILDSGLTVAEQVLEEPSSEIPAGQVIRTIPEQGITVRQGTEIQLIISSGRPMITIPEVALLTAAEAATMLVDAGLEVAAQVLEESSSDVPEGHVIRTDPAQGTSVAESTVITLVLSTGPSLIEVPSVAGASEEDARVEIRVAGLAVAEQVQEEASTDVPAGQIIRTEPEAGTSVAPGTAVVLVISIGPPVTEPEPGEPRVNDIDGATYVYVPAGDFIMGEGENQRTEYTDGFWMKKTEVTNREYRQCLEAGGCTTKPENDQWNDSTYNLHPVTNLKWEHALEYAEWAGGRLPTEAEWEKACRGPDGRRYPWGNPDPTLNHSNHGNNIGGTTPVGTYSPLGDSFYGLQDMSGNVWERTSDPRIIRGGGHRSLIGDMTSTCTFRNSEGNDEEGDRHPVRGFRIVLPEP